MLFFVAGDGKGVRRQEGMGRIWTRFRSAARCNGTRACLKIHSLNLHAPLCAIFASNSVNVARYASLIWHKSPTNCGIHLEESNF